MKASRFSEEKKIGVLREGQSGRRVKAIIAELSVQNHILEEVNAKKW